MVRGANLTKNSFQLSTKVKIKSQTKCKFKSIQAWLKKMGAVEWIKLKICGKIRQIPKMERKFVVLIRIQPLFKVFQIARSLISSIHIRQTCKFKINCTVVLYLLIWQFLQKMSRLIFRWILKVKASRWLLSEKTISLTHRQSDRLTEVHTNS